MRTHMHIQAPVCAHIMQARPAQHPVDKNHENNLLELSYTASEISCMKARRDAHTSLGSREQTDAI